MKVLILIFFLVPAASAATIQVEFAPPASLQGEGTLLASVQAVSVLPTAALEVNGQLETWATITVVTADSHDPVDITPAQQHVQQHDVQGSAFLAVDAIAGSIMWSSLQCEYIVRSTILQGMLPADGKAVNLAPSATPPYPWLRNHEFGQAGSVLFDGQGWHVSACADVTLELFNFRGRVEIDGEWHNVESGEDRHGGVGTISAGIATYQTFRFTNATVSCGGCLEAPVLMAAVDPHLMWNGTILLPIASARASSLGEFLPNGTWRFDGQLTLSSIEASGRRIQVTAVGGASLAIDGTSWFPTAAQKAAAGAVATSLGLALLAALKYVHATALFTRLSPKEALEHPRRRSLLEYIQANPGATFRELCRATSIPAGTCRHHLSVLDRAEVIVEHKHRATVRFFENHGKFDSSWQEVVMLRDPELDRLHGWLRDHGGSIQKDVLEHALNEWGWSRSTTQHRLQRLVDNGLVQVQEMGRRKRYSLLEQPPAQPPRLFGLKV